MERIICLIMGYALGLVQTGYLVGRARGIDIRNYGSKNAGTTNVLRTLGKKYAAIVLLGDALKCVIAVLLCKAVFGFQKPELLSLLMLYSAAGVILGHNFPFYLHFQGGKGIAATLGLAISYFFQIRHGWVVLVGGFGCLAIIFFITHYVSLGSIIGYISMFITVVIIGELGLLNLSPVSDRAYLIEYYIVMGLLTVMAIYRHKENIKRLIAGNERKTYLRSKGELEDAGDQA